MGGGIVVSARIDTRLSACERSSRAVGQLGSDSNGHSHRATFFSSVTCIDTTQIRPADKIRLFAKRDL
jgi:hypothetical protein